jgi:hypothetical protein
LVLAIIIYPLVHIGFLDKVIGFSMIAFFLEEIFKISEELLNLFP